MIRAGTYPLNMYGVGHLSNAIGDALGRILSNCGAMFGGLHLSTVPRSVLDHVPKEKLMGLVVLKVHCGMLKDGRQVLCVRYGGDTRCAHISVPCQAALLCIPYVSPSWTEQAQADMLAGYTKHAHQDVRQQATRAMYRVLRCQVRRPPGDLFCRPRVHPRQRRPRWCCPARLFHTPCLTGARRGC